MLLIGWLQRRACVPNKAHGARKALTLRGVAIYKGWLSPETQAAMVDELRGVVAQAPLFTPVTPRGKAMSVRMTSAGRYGWVDALTF